MDAFIAIISFIFFVLAIALWSGAHFDESGDMKDGKSYIFYIIGVVVIGFLWLAIT